MPGLVKNTSGQSFCFALINANTGAGATGATVSVFITQDGGAQFAGTGALREQGNGAYSYAPTQAETNASNVSFLFFASGAYTEAVEFFTDPAAPVPITPSNDLFDYIFQFPDQGSFLRDPVINGSFPNVPPVQLLVYNPVENLQAPRPATGNVLVSAPQLSVSSVALPGFWGMLTIKSEQASLINHPNIRIVNDRTLMFAGQPSVVLSTIDITHINIIINIFGVYVRDGLQFIPPGLLLEDSVSNLLLEDGTSDLLLETAQ